MAQPPQVSSRTAAPRSTRVKVKTVAGHEIELQHKREKLFYEEARDRYQTDNKFTHASDLRSLDRLLLMETQMFRWQWMLAAGVDYDGNHLDDGDQTTLRRSIKETNDQISKAQADLGLTKVLRDKNDHESVGAYILNLKQRAKEFGVHREKQLGRALELMNEIFAMAGAYKRSNENERSKLGFESAEDVIDFILDVVQPQYDEVDEHFRAHAQKYWIRAL